MSTIASTFHQSAPGWTSPTPNCSGINYYSGGATMEEQIDKTTLLDKIRTEYAAFERLLAPLDEKQMTTAGINGEWSIKDDLDHITAWQQSLFDLLKAAIH